MEYSRVRIKQSFRHDSAIAVSEVSKTFDGGGRSFEALRAVTLTAKRGDFIVIVGPSGCGKTTLLKILAGLVEPTSGSVTIGGNPVLGPGTDRAFVFQEDSVFPWLTVEENIAFGPKALGHSKQVQVQRVDRVLSLTGLLKYRKFYPKQLSGGMRKRVDLGRAYANDPDTFLMDEPFGSLDPFTKEKMQCDLLSMVFKEDRKTVIFVTHDIEEALFLGDRIIVMTPSPGQIASEVSLDLEKTVDPRIKTSRPFQRLRREILVQLSVNEYKRQ